MMFPSRLKLLQDALSSHEIDALLITSSYNIAYLTGIHAFSTEEREARILITQGNNYLLTDPRYSEMVRTKSPFIQLVEIGSGNSFSKALAKILKDEKVKELGFEEENITYKEASHIEEKISSIEMIPMEGIVEELRCIKDNEEIEKIKQACKLTDLTYEFIKTQFKPGMTELKIKHILESFIREKGAHLAFESIVAFGANSAIPHHLSNSSILKSDDVILLDFGAKVDGYCADMTRTLFMGSPSESLLSMYSTTKDAQELAIDYLKTHMKKEFVLKKAHELANEFIVEHGYEKIPHSLGHGVGLQVHELPWVSPYSEENLKPGMTITIEPGIYKPQLGGIRIEDSAVVTTDGIKTLTNASKDLTII